MQTGSFMKLSGEVEVDETYVGGKARNMHAAARKRLPQGRAIGPTANKVPVLGMRERGGRVRAEVVPNVGKKEVQPRVRQSVTPGAALYTDAFLSYRGLDSDFVHRVIDHTEKYVDGRVHTNGIENFWSLLKRGLHGTYVSVEPFHLFRYLDERVFTYNLRHDSDSSRFEAVLSAITGRRLTWAELVGER
jgi:transposase-like protein